MRSVHPGADAINNPVARLMLSSLHSSSTVDHKGHENSKVMTTDTCEANAPIDQLKAISSWVSSVQDLDKLLQLIIESATGVVQAEAASLLLLDPTSGSLYFKVATGDKSEQVKDFKVKIGQGIAGHVTIRPTGTHHSALQRVTR